MNLIFLDIDGVLNSISNLILEYKKNNKPLSGLNYPFDEKCLVNLKRLVDETNSCIVITSTWRMDSNGKIKLMKKFASYDLLDKVIGYTPVLGKSRSEEIKEFLNILSEKPNYIIIDDNSNMDDLIDRLVVTDTYYGLTEEIVEQGKKLLLKKIY